MSSAAWTRYEYQMEMTCEGCSGAAQKVLDKLGGEVTNVDISLEKQRIFVTSTRSADDLLDVLKKTGKPVTFLGSSDHQAGTTQSPYMYAYDMILQCGSTITSVTNKPCRDRNEIMLKETLNTNHTHTLLEVLKKTGKPVTFIGVI